MKHLALAIIIALMPVSAWAGHVYEIQTTDTDGDTDTSIIKLDADHMMLTSPGDSDRVVFDRKNQRLILINDGEQSYRVMDNQAMQAITERMDKLQSQMSRAMANLTPEQREAVQQAMGGKLPGGASPYGPDAPTPPKPDIVVTKTSDHGQHGGYSTVKFEVRKAGVLTDTIWAAKADKVPGGDDLNAAMGEFKDFIKDMLKSFKVKTINLDIWPANPDGYVPVEGTSMEDGEVDKTFELVSAKAEDLPEGTFMIPAGFTEKQTMGRE